LTNQILKINFNHKFYIKNSISRYNPNFLRLIKNLHQTPNHMKIKGKFLSYISEEKKLRKTESRDGKSTGTKGKAALHDVIFSTMNEGGLSELAMR